MSKYFLTREEAYRKLGLTGGDKYFITKDELLSLGADADPLAKYSQYEFVVDDDIISSKNSRPPQKLPWFLFEPDPKNFPLYISNGSFQSYIDPISGLSLQTPATPLVSWDINEGVQELLIHTRSGNNVWSVAWEKVADKYWELSEGNFTIVFIERGIKTTTDSSSTNRGGIVAFYNCTECVGWRNTTTRYWQQAYLVKNPTNPSATTGQNICQLPLVPVTSENMGKYPAMGFISLNRDTKKSLSSGLVDETGTQIQDQYGWGIIEREYVRNGDINPWGSVSGVKTSLVIGRGQAYSYYMIPNNAIGGVAIYDYALTEGELKWLWEHKVVTKPYI